MPERRLVWDIPTRVFHWSLALSFLGSYLTGDSERWALLHVTSGYTLLGLIGFRLIWGMCGTRYARFSEFVPAPKTVLRYISSLFKRQPVHYVGHNPLGAVGILALLLLGLVCAVSGWLVYADVGPDWLETVHEVSAEVMLGLVFVHIAGVLMTSFLYRENLVGSMIDGRKQVDTTQAINAKRPLVALLIFMGMIVFWLWSFSDTLQIGKP